MLEVCLKDVRDIGHYRHASAYVHASGFRMRIQDHYRPVQSKTNGYSQPKKGKLDWHSMCMALRRRTTKVGILTLIMVQCPCIPSEAPPSAIQRVA
ncbi:hypothetical protein VNO77_03376 [Canavalia gladiata]|uniref:Uncharacterized protein n=1 Tax=Canavalia gladiata TaxID=3824 RepID=A0AAN9R6T7_CANGL